MWTMEALLKRYQRENISKFVTELEPFLWYFGEEFNSSLLSTQESAWGSTEEFWISSSGEEISRQPGIVFVMWFLVIIPMQV